MRRFLPLLAFGVGVVHCSASSPDAPSAAAGGPSADALALPQSECAAGTMPVVGKRDCVAVGTTSCADGFAALASGWGCQAVLPAHACKGATRARIGSSDCEAVSDCKAAFPPPGADVVVHDDAELAAALSSVPSGGTIALDAGSYHGIEIAQDVRLVGRCAEQVTFTGTEKRGILVDGKKHLTLSGVTIRSFKGALVVSHGATADVDGVVFSDSPYGLTVATATANVRRSVFEAPTGTATMAIGASDDASVTVADSDVRDQVTVARVWNRSTLTLHRSVVAYEGTKTGHLLGGYSNGHIVVEESALAVHHTGPWFAKMSRVLDGTTSTDASEPGSSLRIVKSELRANDYEDPDGFVIGIHEGSKLEVEESTIDHRADAAFDIRDPETNATFKSSVIASHARQDVMHSAVTVFSGAHADLDGVAIIGPSEEALFAGDVGTTLSLTRSIVSGMETGGQVPEGRDVVSAARGASVQVSESAIAECQGWAVMGIDEGTKVSVDKTLIDPGASIMGAGLIVESGASLAMSGSVVRRCTEAAVTAVGAQGLVTDSAIRQNKIAVRVSDAQFVEADTTTRVPGAHELVFAHTALEDNEEKVAPVPDWMLPKPQ